MKRSNFKKMLVLFILKTAIVFCLFNVSSEAHPGRTDSSGGHNCRTNCESYGYDYGYHYHNGGGGSSSSSYQIEQQQKAKREAERIAKEKRKNEEQERIQNEQEKQKGFDAGYKIGINHGEQQTDFDNTVDNSNSYYQQGFKEGYQKGYDDGKLKFLEEQEKKAEKEAKKAEEERRLAEEKQEKEEFLAVIYNAGVIDGENAYKKDKGSTEYSEIISSYDEEQKKKYIEGFEFGWNNEKMHQQNGGTGTLIFSFLIGLGFIGLMIFLIKKIITKNKSTHNANQYMDSVSVNFQRDLNYKERTQQKPRQNSNIKKGLFGCFGLIFIFGILFSGCVAMFTQFETVEDIEESVSVQVVTGNGS